MRNLLLYLFLFTYTTVMFKPLMPYFVDAVAHLLFFKDHMLTVHSHNGKLHVHAEVAEAAKNENSEKSTNNLKKDNHGYEYLIMQLDNFPPHYTQNNFSSYFSVSIKHAFIDCDFPPPKG